MSLVHGSAPKMPMRSELCAGIEALALDLVGDRQHVARRHHDDVGPEILDQLYLLLSLAAAERDHRQPRAFGAVVRAEPAREQPVAVADVNLVATARAGRADRARDEIRPRVDVARRIADDGRLAGRARRRVNARDLVLRHREHPERIAVAQVALGREREARQIRERFQVVGMHARFVEFAAIDGGVLIRMPERPFQAFELQRGQLVA